MHNLWKTLRYLRPYRGRIAVCIACSLLISVLWGSGLGAVLPGAKILMSPDGLHGWAYDATIENALGMKVLLRSLNSPKAIDGTAVSQVLEVAGVSANSPASAAGVKPHDWLVGLEDGNAADRVLGGKDLARVVARGDLESGIILRVLREGGKGVRETPMDPLPLKFSTKLLRQAALHVPEPKDSAGRFPLLVWLLAFGAVVTVLRNLLRALQEYLVTYVLLRSSLDMRCDVYTRVLRLPATYFSLKGVSDPMSRFIHDIGQVTMGHMTLLGTMTIEPLKFISAVTVAMLLDWKLTLLALAAGAPTVWFIRRFGKALHKASKQSLQAWSDMLSILKETLGGIRVVKTYTLENVERRRFLAVNRALLESELRMAVIDSTLSPLLETLGILAALALLAVAGYYALSRGTDMDQAVFFSLAACFAAMFATGRKQAGVLSRLRRVEPAAARFMELLELPSEKILSDQPHLPRHRESVEFRDVSFRYPASERDVLRGVNLRVNAGETVAVVGHNGAGKTTLVSLLPRLLEPTAGSVLIDGRDIADHSLRSLRGQIAMVSQEDVVFLATVAENIAYGRRRAGREKVIAAARKAYVEEFAKELPQGYDTKMAEGGATLSGGQKQRLSIARAILRDPAILIFDEAMSQVDSQSEHRIRTAMEEFTRERTTFIVAHRFATVLAADRIVVMDEGRIADSGTHQELLSRCKVYQNLYTTQFQATSGRD